MSCLYYEAPPCGRFVALYDDGSGASLFVWDDDWHVIDTDGNDYGVLEGLGFEDFLCERGYGCWKALPEGYAVGLGMTMNPAQDTRWRFAEMPERGTRFVTLRKDGRGADLFFRTPMGAVMDTDGNERFPAWETDVALLAWFVSAGFVCWLPLPGGMRLFFERQS